MTVLLEGIVGSTAYGLAGPDSDEDRLGVYAANTIDLVGLTAPAMSNVTHHPDRTVHEAAKFCQLALGGNPTVMELLWLPVYEVDTDLGEWLRDIRTAFLSKKRVRDAYLGYASSQFKRLADRGDGSFSADLRKRTAKHARHLMRLCQQGLTLYTTGVLPIRVHDPDSLRAFGERVADGAVAEAQFAMQAYERQFDLARSPLPDDPDWYAVERWLRAVRVRMWTQP